MNGHNNNFNIFITKIRTLENALEKKERENAIQIINTICDSSEVEHVIHILIRSFSKLDDILEVALDSFLKTRKDKAIDHGYWVHSLTHFDDYLWENGMTNWIKKLYKISLSGAIKLGNFNCCEGLLSNFCRYSQWNDDPNDYNINMQITSWMQVRPWNKSILERIKAGRFQSASDYLRWCSNHPCFLYSSRNSDLIALGKIRSLISEISKNGENISEFIEMEEKLLRLNLSQLNNNLENSNRKYEHENIEKNIRMLKWALNDYC